MLNTFSCGSIHFLLEITKANKKFSKTICILPNIKNKKKMNIIKFKFLDRKGGRKG